MESNENQLTDDQLNELLRDVSVPSDLKSQLARIPAQQPQSPDLPNSDSPILISPVQHQTAGSLRSMMAFALAAGLIGIGLFVASRYWPPGPVTQPNVANSESSEVERPTMAINNQSPDPAVFETNLVEAFMEGQEQLEAAIRAAEVIQMEAQLAGLERAASVRLEQREIESLIAAVSQEYAVPVGASKQKTKSEMNQVIQQYPGTRGAQIAHEFLAQESY